MPSRTHRNQCETCITQAVQDLAEERRDLNLEPARVLVRVRARALTLVTIWISRHDHLLCRRCFSLGFELVL